MKNKTLKLAIAAILFLCQTAVAATLDVGSQKGEKGDTVTFNINVSDLTEEMDSLGFDVQYDFAILKYDSYQRGSLTENFRQLGALNIDLGKVRIGGFDTGENVIAGGAGGDIVRLTFEVVGQGDCNIKVTNLKDDLKSYAAQGGRFTYGPQNDDDDTESDDGEADATAEPDDNNTAPGPTSGTSGNTTQPVATTNPPQPDADGKSENNGTVEENTGTVKDASGKADEVSESANPPDDSLYPPDLIKDGTEYLLPPIEPQNIPDTGGDNREIKKKTKIQKGAKPGTNKKPKPTFKKKPVIKPQTRQSAKQIQTLIDKNAELIKQSHKLIKENLKLIRQNNALILKNSYMLEYMEKTKPASDNVILIVVGILILLVLIFIFIALLLLLLHFGFFSSKKSVRVRIERK
ncbi:cohesin domain-containing protein [Desulfococcaceae bacterium HSG9]|nr:cohesin domain-containing protein [Desulfococcaceae bacterium HSG9]